MIEDYDLTHENYRIKLYMTVVSGSAARRTVMDKLLKIENVTHSLFKQLSMEVLVALFNQH